MIQLKNLTVRAGPFALHNVQLEVPGGQYAVLMGRTGVGKTTLLEAICGLKRVASGGVHLMGRDVTNLKPAERGIGFVPQDGAMFHTMTVAEQIGFAMRIRRRPKPEITARVNELAELLSLTHLLDRKPHGLSGGEIQRVALGRALAARPGILCLDEPFSALDEDTRHEMYELLRTVHRQTHVTTLHITHNAGEMRQLADQLFILDAGRITSTPVTLV